MSRKKLKKSSIKEATGVDGSPGVKGYAAYTPSEKWNSYRNNLTKVVKKTTGYKMVGDKRIPSDTIDKSDNPINKEPQDDKNISPKKMEFKPIKESVNRKRITVKEVVKWMKGLEENKWRKTYNVDARRVSHFANFGESVELPKSLRKRSKNATYVREMQMAKNFLKHIKNKMNENQLREFVRNKLRGIINE